MKNFIIFLILPFCFFGNNFNLNTSSAMAEKTTYAKALENCTLYKTQSLEHESDNIFFVVPESYFVTILNKISETCYKVQYDRFIGFINPETIIIATFTPIVKTLGDITFDIKSTSGTQIWSKPSTDSKILTTISAGETNIKYIASAYGEIPVGGDGNLWFYASFTPSSGSTNVYEGYIYSENTTNLSEIINNTEVNPEVISNTLGSNTIYLSSSLKTIVVAIITIPIVIFLLIILYKSTKKVKDYTNKQNSAKNQEFYQNQKTNGFDFDSSRSQSNNNHYYEKQEPKNNLISGLSKLKNMTFLKRASSEHDDNQYPNFPDYNSDDDIL